MNPNTVMRAYERLERDRIVSNRRGIGFFVEPEARTRTLAAPPSPEQATINGDTLLIRNMPPIGFELPELQNYIVDGVPQPL